MNEELNNRLLESLTTILDFIEKAGNFTAEQAPLVVQELLNWEFWVNFIYGTVWLVVPSILLGILFYLGYKIDWDEEIASVCVIGIVIWCISFVISISYFLDVVKVVVAPRLVVIEKLQGLIK